MSAASIATPPRALAGILQQLGPGLIITASIVGSGELIMTMDGGMTMPRIELQAVIAAA